MRSAEVMPTEPTRFLSPWSDLIVFRSCPLQADHGPESPRMPASRLSRVASFASQPERPLTQKMSHEDLTDAPDGQRLILSPRDQATRPRIKDGGVSMGPPGATELRGRQTPAADLTDAPDGQRLILSPRDQAIRPRIKDGGVIMKPRVATEARARRTPVARADRAPPPKKPGSSTDSLDISAIQQPVGAHVNLHDIHVMT